MAEYLTSCELMQQCQWIQFQKDNHFTIFLQKYLKLDYKTEHLLGMNAGCAALYLPTQRQTVELSFFKQCHCSRCLRDPRCLDIFVILFVRLSGQSYKCTNVRTRIWVARAPGKLDVLAYTSAFLALVQNMGVGDKRILRSPWAS